MTGVAKGTALRLLAEVGDACEAYQNETLRDLRCERIQCDEIWGYVQAKQNHIPKQRRGEYGIGDMWTWVAIDADSKLVPCWLLGHRNASYAHAFISDLAGRLKNRVQLTTDGLRQYLEPIDAAFGGAIDFAQVIKIFAFDPEPESQRRYSPPICTGIRKVVVEGDPDPDAISTSYIERQNLTLRMHNRRLTRLTNAFSKKAENLNRSLALHFMYYNFCRKHSTIKTTPAIAAGVTDRVWTLRDLSRLPAMMTGAAA
jgi:IS1 family transposase